MPDKLTKVEFSNLEKVLYPQLGITKAKVIEYYVKLAPKMLGLLAERPIVLTRYPNGVEKKGFYEKNAPLGTPRWVKTFTKYSETADHYVNYIVCNDLDTLVWIANLAALELHVPLSMRKSVESPDLILFDMDPKTPAGINEVVDVALLLKDKLDSLGLKSFVKTTGKKGLHVVIPITGGHTFDQTRDFVHTIGIELARESNKVVAEAAKPKISGKIFMDYAQNSNGRTMVCPYSLRVTSDATVSTPLEWMEVRKGLNPMRFNILNVPGMHSDPWKNILNEKQKL